MRAVIEENLKTDDAVKLYHDELKQKNLIPDRSLKKDLEITDPILKL